MEQTFNASTHHLKSIAFPAISTGAYGYPLREAARIALQTISSTSKNTRTSNSSDSSCMIIPLMIYSPKN
jgi:O-acetyl-ADP-ribose deacetylase (regulator of RNase III)